MEGGLECATTGTTEVRQRGKHIDNRGWAGGTQASRKAKEVGWEWLRSSIGLDEGHRVWVGGSKGHTQGLLACTATIHKEVISSACNFTDQQMLKLSTRGHPSREQWIPDAYSCWHTIVPKMVNSKTCSHELDQTCNVPGSLGQAYCLAYRAEECGETNGTKTHWRLAL